MSKTYVSKVKRMPKTYPTTQRFGVQFTFACEDPLNNVRVTLLRGVPTFQVPMNHPLVHNMGLEELTRAVAFGEKLDLSTEHNNTGSEEFKRTVVSALHPGKILTPAGRWV